VSAASSSLEPAPLTSIAWPTAADAGAAIAATGAARWYS
jgi:hypothetical protein